MLDEIVPDQKLITHGEEYQQVSLELSPNLRRNIRGKLETRKWPHGWLIVPSVVIGAAIWAVVLL